MRRKALIIGNSGDIKNPAEYIEGVKQDVNNYKKFLMSNIGGEWNESEIIISLDENKRNVQAKMHTLKTEKNDMVFVLFSGHGNYSTPKECRRLYLFEEFIYEDDLLYLAPKQITVIDTCAGIESEISEGMKLMAEVTEFRKMARNYRRQYENAVISCPRQQVVLYSSSRDELSGDDSELGGYFAYNLLGVAYENNQDILSAKEAYMKAKIRVQIKTKYEQNPNCKCPRTTNILPFALKK